MELILPLSSVYVSELTAAIYHVGLWRLNTLKNLAFHYIPPSPQVILLLRVLPLHTYVYITLCYKSSRGTLDYKV